MLPSLLCGAVRLSCDVPRLLLPQFQQNIFTVSVLGCGLVGLLLGLLYLPVWRGRDKVRLCAAAACVYV